MTQTDPTTSQELKNVSEGRHFLAVFFLSFMWGAFGVDRFYLGKIWTGLLKLLTFGGFGIWTLVDLVLIMSGSMRDKEGREMLQFARYKKFAVKTVLVFAVVMGIVMLISGTAIIYGVYEFITTLQNNSGDIKNLLPSGSDLPSNLTF